MLEAFGGSLTAQQIVSAARRRVGSPDLHLTAAGVEDVTAPAYVELQMVLDDLALSHDWPWSRIICTFPITARSQPIPSSLWRISFSDPVILIDNQNGARMPFLLTAEDVFFKQLGPANAQGAPTRFFIQKSMGLCYVDPIPDRAYTGEAHIQPWHTPLYTITDLPWFPWSRYLVSALAVALNLDQDDSRVQAEAQLAQTIMRDIRHSISDQGERTASLVLSPTHYRTPLRI